MKKIHGLFWFIGLQVLLVLIYIYKESCFIAVFYEQQRLEKRRDAALNQRKNLQHQLEALKSRGAIQKFAKETLGLQPVALSSLRKIDAHEST
jgi:cell division protein FtsL